VFLGITISFLQGLATAYLYRGSPAALALQIAMAATGLALVFRVPLAELAGRTLYPGSVKNGSSRPSST
jgi:hypothetical protein